MQFTDSLQSFLGLPTSDDHQAAFTVKPKLLMVLAKREGVYHLHAPLLQHTTVSNVMLNRR